ncbi:MAG: hypothetical protein SFW67_04000 [Myxococcaceae bacterium]|nr:hypothetical protein [Myxococcaceae bacterium]
MMMMPDGGATGGGRPGGGAAGGSAGGVGGGSAGGAAAGGSAAGGSAGGSTGGGSAGGAMAGGSAGGASAGGTAGGSTAGGSAGGSSGGGSAGGAMAGGSAGGSTAGGSAGGSSAGGSAGGSTAGGSAGGSTAGGSAGGSTAGGSAGGSTAGGSAGGVAFDPCLSTAYDAGVPGGALLADGGFTPPGSVLTADAGVTATAVSSFSGYPPESVLDFDLDTSWYIASGQCAPGPVSPLECCSTQTLSLQLPTARSVSAIVIRGNRGTFADDYDFLTGRLDLIDANGSVLSSTPVVFSRPDSDWATVFSPVVTNVRTVRFVPGWSENEGGLAELQVFSP